LRREDGQAMAHCQLNSLYSRCLPSSLPRGGGTCPPAVCRAPTARPSGKVCPLLAFLPETDGNLARSGRQKFLRCGVKRGPASIEIRSESRFHLNCLAAVFLDSVSSHKRCEFCGLSQTQSPARSGALVNSLTRSPRPSCKGCLGFPPIAGARQRHWCLAPNASAGTLGTPFGADGCCLPGNCLRRHNRWFQLQSFS